MKSKIENSWKSAALACLCMLTSIGCASGTTSGTGSSTTSTGTTTTTTTPAIPAGWKNFTSTYFSFDYPNTFTISDSTSAAQPTVIVNDPNNQHQVYIQFVPGFVNQAQTFDQCASVDAVLTQFYLTNFAKLETTPSTKYPRISVTEDGPTANMGVLGGADDNISVGMFATLGSANTGYTYQVQGVPRMGGLYVVGIQNPDQLVSPSFFNTFLGTFVMTAPALASGAYCNYLH